MIFLNHGSFGATPRPVFEQYQAWQRELERQPVEFLGRRFASLMETARKSLAGYLGTHHENLVYVPNATVGLNIVARSLNLGEGDEVLASDHEYGALDRTWRFLANQQGYKYINHPLSLPVASIDSFVDQFWQAVTPRTRVIFLSHITSPTAVIFPIQQICTRARQAGILTVIDGAHAPGQIPLELDDLGADFYSGNLHKWLCAPKGAAFLYVRPEVQNLIQPLVVSWGFESEHPGPSRFVDLLEWVGTRDISAYLSVPAAIHFQNEHDWPALRQRCHLLARQARQEITALTGLPALYPDTAEWYAQMGTAQLPPQADLDTLKSRLYEEYRIEIPLINWNGYHLIRFSLQAYNTRADIDALLSALRQLL